MKKSKYIAAIVYALLLTVIWIFSPIKVAEENVTTEQTLATDQVIPELYDSVECKQCFELPAFSKIQAIDVQLATYVDNVTVQEISFSVYSEKGEMLHQVNVNTSELSDNAYYQFSFEESISARNGSYYFVIKGNEPQTEGSVGPAVWCSFDKNIDVDEILYINGVMQPGARI